MANQIVVSAGAKVRNLDGVLTGTSGVVNSLPINASNGIPQLDVNGKILVSQLPNSVMEYQGVWNANTNTPTLTNGGAFNQGDVYLCNVAGTTNFGAGPISFIVGDQAIYSGTIWQKAGGATGTVTSVAITESGDSLNITGSPITTSGTINIGFNGTNLQYVNGAGNLSTFPTLITSIGLSMPSAFSVANSPLTANGTIAVTGAGYASQYIRGDGTLADFPSSGGGGSSVSYYLNGGTSQGTIGGVTYYEMSKTADTGTGVDFTKSGDGFIVAFLTDANDPALLNIPAGNWNYEIYASMSANGGTPQMYAELYKYDGTTFTLISTSSNEILYDGTNLNLYTFGMTVPATTLALTDRLAIKLYATNSGGKTTTVHTQDSHLCQVITTFSTGITALNGLTAQVQYFQVGTSGTDFNISSTTATHTFNLPTANAANRGALSSADWTIFNGKQPQLNGTGFVKASGTTITYDNSTYYLASNPSAFIALTALSAGTGISYNNTTGVITNSAPDQTVSLTAGAGISVSGSYPSFTIASTITQYTDALARAALSFAAGSGAYNSTTGVITIPTDNSQIANGAGYITSSALSGYLPLTGGTLTGALNGTSASFSSTVTAVGYSKFWNGSNSGLLIGNFSANAGYGAIYSQSVTPSTTNFALASNGLSTIINATNDASIVTNNGNGLVVMATGNVIINNGTTDSGYKLDVNGTGRFSGDLRITNNNWLVYTDSTATARNILTLASNDNLYLQYKAGSNFYLRNTDGDLRLTISSTGAATFSSTGQFGGDLTLNSSAINTQVGIVLKDNGTTKWQIYKSTANDFRIYRQGSANDALVISTSDAATFSSSVTAGGGNFVVHSNGNASIGNSTQIGTLYIAGDTTIATNANIGSNGGYMTLQKAGGNVGIGTSSPSGALTVAGANGAGISIDQGNYNYYGAYTHIFKSSSYTTEFMRITSDGNLLLGTTDNGSGAKLVFYSTTAAQQLKAAGTAPAITFSNTITSPTIGGSLGACTSANQFLSGTAAGDMILINQFTGNKLYITNYSGGVYLTQGATSWTANSDIRLKNINSHIENAVEKLSTLQTINFSYKDDKTNKQNLGLIAQEVEKIFPELIDKNGDGMLGVRYTELVPVLIKAIQEQQKEINELKLKIK